MSVEIDIGNYILYCLRLSCLTVGQFSLQMAKDLDKQVTPLLAFLEYAYDFYQTSRYY